MFDEVVAALISRFSYGETWSGISGDVTKYTLWKITKCNQFAISTFDHADCALLSILEHVK